MKFVSKKVINYPLAICVILLCVISVSQAGSQKKGFRGGDKGYGIKIEANPIGTNLFYQLPESKAKSSAPADWKVDNDNAEMQLAMNLPVAAILLTTNPKFSVQGSWPGYKTDLKLPKGTTTAKKNEMLRANSDQSSGLRYDLDQGDIASLPGSEGAIGSADLDKNRDTSGSGSAEDVNEDGESLDDPESSSSGSGSAESDDKESTVEKVQELRRRSQVAHNAKTGKTAKSLIRNHRTGRSSHKEEEQEEDNTIDNDGDDMFLNKVKKAVKNLKKFNFNDPKTSKALKDIIIHAKRVVGEAKTVLRDVNSVVRSVQNFVTGNYDNIDDDDEVSMSLPDENTGLEKSAENARENAERAARKANFAANRAQAASKMAVEIADNFWKVAQKSRALSKLSDAVSAKNRKTVKKIINLHGKGGKREQLSKKLSKATAKHQPETQDNIVLTPKTTTKAKTASKNNGYRSNKKSNESQPKDAERKIQEEIHTNKTAKQTEDSPNKIITQQRFGLHNSPKFTTENEPVTVDAFKAANNFPNQDDASDLSTQALKYADRLLHDSGPQNPKANTQPDKLVTKVVDIAKKDAKLAKKMAAIVNFKVQTLRKLKSKITDKQQIKKLTSHEKKVLETPKDANEVVKNDHFANHKERQKSKHEKADEALKKHYQHMSSNETKNENSGSGDVNDSDQSETTMSGSYDVELEVEPDQLDLTKDGTGRMKEKKIRIKTTSVDGRTRKISPVTFGKILQAIRKVEGILGFTIEKENKSLNRKRFTKTKKEHKINM